MTGLGEERAEFRSFSEGYICPFCQKGSCWSVFQAGGTTGFEILQCTYCKGLCGRPSSDYRYPSVGLWKLGDWVGPGVTK